MLHKNCEEEQEQGRRRRRTDYADAMAIYAHAEQCDQSRLNIKQNRYKLHSVCVCVCVYQFPNALVGHHFCSYLSNNNITKVNNKCNCDLVNMKNVGNRGRNGLEKKINKM